MNDATAAFRAIAVHKKFRRVKSMFDYIRLKKPGYVTALDGFSIEVAPGEIACVLGRNGAGKTTLLKTAAGLIAPDAGELRIWGRDPWRTRNGFARVGLVAGDERGFYWRLSGRENLRFFASLWALTGKRANRRIDEVMELVGLADRRRDRDPVRTYSSGMKQRLAFARALIAEPHLLLVDELARSLDFAAALDLAHFIRDELVAGGGRSAIMATHQLWVAREMGGTVYVIDDGALVAKGSPADVLGGSGKGRYYLTLARRPDEAVLDTLPMPSLRDSESGYKLSFEEPAAASEAESTFAELGSFGIRSVERDEGSVSEEFIELLRGPGGEAVDA
ncbi:MAG: ABC transporter ATP-binding protein [bacterium]|nr:ABC transporter ATP-binding protein [bacterium]